MTEEKLSYHDYAALLLGDETDGTWLWCQVAEAGKVRYDEDFYANVLHGNWQVKAMPVLRMAMVMNTGQMIPNVRLAYFGQVPASLSGVNPAVYDLLRTGAYLKWPGYTDPGF